MAHGRHDHPMAPQSKKRRARACVTHGKGKFTTFFIQEKGRDPTSRLSVPTTRASSHPVRWVHAAPPARNHIRLDLCWGHTDNDHVRSC